MEDKIMHINCVRNSEHTCMPLQADENTLCALLWFANHFGISPARGLRDCQVLALEVEGQA
jgi:hypothetical protein